MPAGSKADDMTEPRALSAPNQALQPSWSGYDVEPPEQSAVPLAHYLWILRRHRWKIIAFVLACVTATLIVSARLTPIYESTVTVDVDRQIPSAIIGQDAARAERSRCLFAVTRSADSASEQSRPDSAG